MIKKIRVINGENEDEDGLFSEEYKYGRVFNVAQRFIEDQLQVCNRGVPEEIKYAISEIDHGRYPLLGNLTSSTQLSNISGAELDLLVLIKLVSHSLNPVFIDEYLKYLYDEISEDYLFSRYTGDDIKTKNASREGNRVAPAHLEFQRDNVVRREVDYYIDQELTDFEQRFLEKLRHNKMSEIEKNYLETGVETLLIDIKRERLRPEVPEIAPLLWVDRGNDSQETPHQFIEKHYGRFIDVGLLDRTAVKKMDRTLITTLERHERSTKTRPPEEFIEKFPPSRKTVEKTKERYKETGEKPTDYRERVRLENALRYDQKNTR